MNLHVIIGADDYLVDETAKKIVGDGVGLEMIDSAAASNADAQLADLRRADASFSTPPFLDPKKVTWWRHVHFLPGGGKRDSSEEVKVALEAFARKLVAASLPDNQHFILSGPSLLKTSIVAKTLMTGAEMVVLTAAKPWEETRNAVLRVTEAAQEMGLAFATGAADRFVAVVGTDTRSLMSELGKLRDYLGDEQREIRAAEIEQISSRGFGVEPAVWSVTDALGARNLAGALTAAAQFASESGFSVMMTSVIEKFFRQLLDVAQGRTAGLNPYVAKKMAAHLHNWSVPELRTARARFFGLREKVVSGVTSGDDLVFIELVRVCRRRAR